MVKKNFRGCSFAARCICVARLLPGWVTAGGHDNPKIDNRMGTNWVHVELAEGPPYSMHYLCFACLGWISYNDLIAKLDAFFQKSFPLGLQL